MLTDHDLLTLARSAEYMASDSSAEDRGGQCSAQLHNVAQRARRESETERAMRDQRETAVAFERIEIDWSSL